MNYRLFITIVFSLFLLFPGSVAADESSLLDYAKRSTREMVFEDVSIVERGDKVFLLGIGASQYRPKDKKSILQARKTSRMKALQALTKFVNDTRIESFESLKKTVRVSTDGKKKHREVKKEYYSYIQAKSDGILRDLSEVGYWKDTVAHDYFCGLAVEIDKQ